MEEGRRYNVGKVNLLELCGTYREMGRQYGRLFKEGLAAFYRTAIEGYFIKESRMPYLKLLALAGLIFHRYPQNIKEMIRGMSEGSGVALSRIIMLDQINTFEFMRNQNVGRCSNIAVWGSHTGGDVLLLGRNYDQPERFRAFNEFITIAVFSPDGGIPTASIGYAGQIGVTSAINRHGIFITNNEAPTTRSDRININTPSVLVLEFDFLTRALVLDALDQLIRSAKANCPVIVTAGDGKRAHIYEWSAAGLRRRAEDVGDIAVATNHFADPSWGEQTLSADDFAMTLGRRANLLSLGERFKGRIDVQRMKEVLSLTVDKGGATHIGRTTFQMIMVPERLEMHFKVPDYQDWTEIDLKTPLTRYVLTGDAEFSVQKI